jgi:two-component system, response regulator
MEEKTILLVEDNPDDVILTKIALEKSRISNKIVVAEDGVEALDYLFGQGKFAGRVAGKLPEIVLLDLKLPRISGLEVLKQIRANPLTSMLPVVILTSSSMDKDIISGYKLGCNSYITKPVDFNQFLNAVQQLEIYWLILNKNPYSGVQGNFGDTHEN